MSATSTHEPELVCCICNKPILKGQMVLPDYTEGLGHRACFGDAREGFCNLETGEPLGPDEPIPDGEPYEPKGSGAPTAVGGEVERRRAGWMLIDDNGKRWRICDPTGRWVMQPEGVITADEARTICETAMGTALATHPVAPQPDVRVKGLEWEDAPPVLPSTRYIGKSEVGPYYVREDAWRPEGCVWLAADGIESAKAAAQADCDKRRDLPTQPGGAAEADELAEILGDILREAISERGMGWRPRVGNAPGHGHETPGVWDDDNGPLAGKPCKWCAAWKRGLDTLHARAKRTANQKDS